MTTAAVAEAAKPAECRAQAAPDVQHVVLHNVSWSTYEALLDEPAANAGTRLNYDRGVLEIMVVSSRHELIKHIIETLVRLIAIELDIDLVGVGSTTFRREDLARGFEPDGCFYFQHAAEIREKSRRKENIDLTIDPAPELIIEVDVTRSSLDKLPIYAALDVGEVWRYVDADDRLQLLTPGEGEYIDADASRVLTGFDRQTLGGLIDAGLALSHGEWVEKIRAAVAEWQGS